MSGVAIRSRAHVEKLGAWGNFIDFFRIKAIYFVLMKCEEIILDINTLKYL